MSEGKKGFFGRLVEGLTKTRNNIVSGIDSIFSGFSAIDDDFYEEIEETLIMGDIGHPDHHVHCGGSAPEGEGAAHQGAGGVQGAADQRASRPRWIWGRTPTSSSTKSPWCW